MTAATSSGAWSTPAAGRLSAPQYRDDRHDGDDQQHDPGYLPPAQRRFAGSLAGLPVDQEPPRLVLVDVGGNPHREQQVLEGQLAPGCVDLQVSVGVSAHIPGAQVVDLPLDARLAEVPTAGQVDLVLLGGE